MDRSALHYLKVAAGIGMGLAAPRAGDAALDPPPSGYEPVHGWPRRQMDEYLARNPAYRPIYETRLRGHSGAISRS